MPDCYGIEEATEYLSWVAVELKLVNALHYWLSTVTPGPDAWSAQGAGDRVAFGHLGSCFANCVAGQSPTTLRPQTVLAWTEFPVDMTRFLFG